MYLSLKVSVFTSVSSEVLVAEHHSFRPADGATVACRPVYLARVSARLPQTWLKNETDMRLAYQSRSPDFASSRRLKGTRFWSMRVSFLMRTACDSALMMMASA